jgi:hypothetical protein
MESPLCSVGLVPSVSACIRQCPPGAPTTDLEDARERDAIEALDPIAHLAETVPVGGQNAA